MHGGHRGKLLPRWRPARNLHFPSPPARRGEMPQAEGGSGPPSPDSGSSPPSLRDSATGDLRVIPTSPLPPLGGGRCRRQRGGSGRPASHHTARMAPFYLLITKSGRARGPVHTTRSGRRQLQIFRHSCAPPVIPAQAGIQATAQPSPRHRARDGLARHSPTCRRTFEAKHSPSFAWLPACAAPAPDLNRQVTELGVGHHAIPRLSVNRP